MKLEKKNLLIILAAIAVILIGYPLLTDDSRKVVDNPGDNVVVGDTPNQVDTTDNLPTEVSPPDVPLVNNSNNNISPTEPAVASLAGSAWSWQGATVNGEDLTPTDSSEFILTFSTDGTFRSTTDCNSASGNYVQNREIVTFEQIAVTEIGCLEETLESDYVSLLSQVQSHSVSGDGILILKLMLDFGEATFLRAAQ